MYEAYGLLCEIHENICKFQLFAVLLQTVITI